jgi:hypothetical protein
VRDFVTTGKRYSGFGNNALDIAMLAFYLPSIIMRIHERYHYSDDEFLALGGRIQDDGTVLPLADGARAVYVTAGADFVRARSWHGMAGILFWVRLVDYFRVSRTLGPLWLVLIRVSWDALLFFLILLVFMISFGVAIICAARPRPNPGDTFYGLLGQAIFFPYFEIFGEHFLSGYSLSFDDYPKCEEQGGTCSSGSKLGIILLGIYLFVATIVLMNLLIASEPPSFPIAQSSHCG